MIGIGVGIGVNSYVAGGTVPDADAQAFITAAGITDSTQKDACNKLIVDLKGYGLWTKMVAVYGLLGGTAASHKFNWKDPRDLDAAYRIVWSGGVTHDANGITGNGSNGYGDTKLSNIVLAQNSLSLGVYSRTNSDNTSVDMASGTGVAGGLVRIRSSNAFRAWVNDSSTSDAASTDSRGLFSVSRTAVNSRATYINGVSVASAVTGTSTPADFNYYLLARNQSAVANSFSARNLAFAYVSSGLNATEMANLYTAIQAYQTSLTRQV